MPPPSAQAAAWRFFLPLVVTTALMRVTQPIIHAALARLAAPRISLAAFSVGIAFHGTLGGPIWASQYLALAFARDKGSVRRLVRFHLYIAAVLAGVEVLVAFTSLGDFVFGTVFGAGPAVVAQARWVPLLMAAEFPLVSLRSVAHALMMMEQRTGVIPVATALRIATVVALLALLPRWFVGAPVGAAAFVLAVAAECALMVRLAWGAYRALPGELRLPPSLAVLWRFDLPLMMNLMAEFGVPLAINFFLGRLARANQALATFGVLGGLARLLHAPLRNLTQLAQTFAPPLASQRLLFRFTGEVVLLVSLGLAGLFFTPAREWLFAVLLGLPEDLIAYLRPALWLILPMGVALGAGCLLRGLLTHAGHTAPIGHAALLQLAVVGLLGLPLAAGAEWNGAVYAMGATAAAFAAESLLLGWQWFRRRA